MGQPLSLRACAHGEASSTFSSSCSLSLSASTTAPPMLSSADAEFAVVGHRHPVPLPSEPGIRTALSTVHLVLVCGPSRRLAMLGEAIQPSPHLPHGAHHRPSSSVDLQFFNDLQENRSSLQYVYDNSLAVDDLWSTPPLSLPPPFLGRHGEHPTVHPPSIESL
jgi:DNA-binding transcriptional LysR family regulator